MSHSHKSKANYVQSKRNFKVQYIHIEIRQGTFIHFIPWQEQNNCQPCFSPCKKIINLINNTAMTATSIKTTLDTLYANTFYQLQQQILSNAESYLQLLTGRYHQACGLCSSHVCIIRLGE